MLSKCPLNIFLIFLNDPLRSPRKAAAYVPRPCFLGYRPKATTRFCQVSRPGSEYWCCSSAVVRGQPLWYQDGGEPPKCSHVLGSLGGAGPQNVRTNCLAWGLCALRVCVCMASWKPRPVYPIHLSTAFFKSISPCCGMLSIEFAAGLRVFVVWAAG